MCFDQSQKWLECMRDNGVKNNEKMEIENKLEELRSGDGLDPGLNPNKEGLISDGGVSKTLTKWKTKLTEIQANVDSKIRQIESEIQSVDLKGKIVEKEE